MSFCSIFHASLTYDGDIEVGFNCFIGMTMRVFTPINEHWHPNPEMKQQLIQLYHDSPGNGIKIVACFNDDSAKLLKYCGIPFIDILAELDLNLKSFGIFPPHVACGSIHLGACAPSVVQKMKSKMLWLDAKLHLKYTPDSEYKRHLLNILEVLEQVSIDDTNNLYCTLINRV